MMEQRVSLITLGVDDIEAEAGFYEALGWQRVDAPEGIVAFDLIGQNLSLYPLEKLAEDIGVPAADLGHGAVTLAYNCRDRAGVDDTMAAAQAAGATILRAAGEVFWGGYVGYFRSPGGPIWEVTFNPYAPLAANGAFRWSGFG